MAGRRPKPSKLRALQGIPSHKLAKNEPEPLEIEPAMPPSLSDRAREVWKAAVDQLVPLGIVTETDGAVLGIFCQATADVEEHQQHIEDHGRYQHSAKGHATRHPANILLREALDRQLRSAIELGLTPSARTRVKVAPKKGDGLGQWAQLRT
jgi:P27 family predicted phage terminase small subunit